MSSSRLYDLPKDMLVKLIETINEQNRVENLTLQELQELKNQVDKRIDILKPQCQHFYQRGKDTGLQCPNKALEGRKYCSQCIKKHSIHRNYNDEQIIFYNPIIKDKIKYYTKEKYLY